MKIPEIYNAKEIAQILKVKVKTFYAMVRGGRFPKADISYHGKMLRWKSTTIKKWIDGQKS